MATPLPQNQCELTLAEVADATAGRLVGADGAAVISGISTDTRLLRPGALFVALQGRNDGHRYLDTAAKLGAAAALTGRGLPAGPLPRVEVGDTLVALGRLARFHARRIRALNPLPVIAIGGAVGKTSTKELTAALARARYGSVLATAGNLNNLIGVPLTLLSLNQGHRAAVIECGTNAPGEIARLGEIVEPDVALVLNAEIEHTEGLGSLEGIADEEAAMFGAARRAVVTSAQDRRLIARLPSGLTRIVLFGGGEGADVRLLERRLAPGGRQHLRLGLSPRVIASGAASEMEAELQLMGPAAALNAAAAVAALAACEPLEAGEFARLQAALAAVAPVAGRLQMKSAGGLLVLDDTYNSSPSSVRAALAAAREAAGQAGARLVVILGDMLELGALSGAMHEAAIADAIAAAPSVLIVAGAEMTRALHTIQVPAAIAAPAAANSAQAAVAAQNLTRAGDVVLVKGSRGMEMERVIEALDR